MSFYTSYPASPLHDDLELLSWIVASTLVVVIRSSNATLQATLLLNPPVNVAMVSKRFDPSHDALYL